MELGRWWLELAANQDHYIVVEFRNIYVLYKHCTNNQELAANQALDHYFPLNVCSLLSPRTLHFYNISSTNEVQMYSYSWPSVVWPDMEELISPPFVGENRF